MTDKTKSLHIRQAKLMAERNNWEDKKADNPYDEMFGHYCETKMHRCEIECDDIRRTLYEMGCV